MTTTIPTPTSPAQVAASAVLKNRAVLVSFHGAYYHWLRRDTVASAEHAKAKGISPQAFQTYQNIFLSTDKLLTQIKDVVNNARSYHNLKTVDSSWADYKLLLNTDIKDYREAMLKFGLELSQLLDQLKDNWPDMIAGAANALGPVFSAKAYPTIQSVIDNCKIDYQLVPMPDADGFGLKDLDPDIADSLRAELSKSVTDATQQAVANLGDQLMTMLEHAKSNLSKTGAADERFRVEWHDNLQEFLPKLQGFLGDNPAVAALAQRIDNFLVNTDTKTLKKKVDARTEAKTELDSIMQDFGAMFGKKQ